MRFDFDRSHSIHPVVKVRGRRRSGKGGCYLFHSFKVGPVRVLRKKLRVEVHPEVGEYTGHVLLDFVGKGSQANEAILTAEDGWKLRDYFRRNGIKFPGVSPVSA